MPNEPQQPSNPPLSSYHHNESERADIGARTANIIAIAVIVLAFLGGAIYFLG
jgi:hypothetical protein